MEKPRKTVMARRKTKTASQLAPMPLPHVACDLERVQLGCNWGAIGVQLGCNGGAMLPGAIPCCLPGRREAEGERETHSHAPGRLKRLPKWHPCPPHVACDLERVQWGAIGVQWGATGVQLGCNPAWCHLLLLPWSPRSRGGARDTQPGPRKTETASQVAPMPPTRCLRPGEGAKGCKRVQLGCNGGAMEV